MPNQILALEDVSVHYGATLVLKNISFEIQTNDFITIVGPNGAGKTSLLRTILGLMPISSGIMHQKEKQVVSYVPSDLNIQQTLPLTVKDFLNLPQPPPKSDGIVNELLDGLEPGFDNYYLSELSAGQVQHLLLIKALSRKPDLLVLDEADKGLDYARQVQLYEVLGKLHDQGMTIVMSSHQLHIVLAITTKVMCLNQHICCLGTPQHVLENEQFVQLFGSNLAQHIVPYRHKHDHVH